MRVFTYYDPDLESAPVGHIIRAWELSWKAQGWEPTLLIPRLARTHPYFKRTLSETPDEKDRHYWVGLYCALEVATKNDPDKAMASVSFRTFNQDLPVTDLLADGPTPSTLMIDGIHRLFLSKPRAVKCNSFFRRYVGVTNFPDTTGRLVHFSPENTFPEVQSLGPYNVVGQ